MFEPGDWVRIPAEHHYSDLRSNPFEEEENDATLVSVPSIILDPGDLRVTVQDKRAKSKEQACRTAQEQAEATKKSN